MTKKNFAYKNTNSKDGTFSPIFRDKAFVTDFSDFCRVNNIQKTQTALKWLKERLAQERDAYYESLSKEDLILLLKERNGNN